MPRKKKSAGGPVSACCPYCASRVSLPVACLGVSIAPGAESPYFRRLQKAENLVVEFAGVVKSVLRGKRILEQWLVDSGFVDSSLQPNGSITGGPCQDASERLAARLLFLRGSVRGIGRARLFSMHLSSWIGGFFLGVTFAVLCAWIDGWFYRRRYRDQITLARFMDFVHTLDLVSLDMLRHQLDAARRMHEQLLDSPGERQP